MSLEYKYNVHVHDHPNDFSFETTSLQGNLSVHSSMPWQSSQVSRKTLPDVNVEISDARLSPFYGVCLVSGTSYGSVGKAFRIMSSV